MCKRLPKRGDCEASPPDLGEIVRRYTPAFLASHRTTPAERKVLTDLGACRTAALGGHLEQCDQCATTRAVYHSCRNRHCPKCQVLAKEEWLEARCADLLPIDYFHVVFTVPHELNTLARSRPRILYNLLFRTAAETLRTFASDPKHLGAELGFTSILHTWGQNLSQHVHLHCVVTAGGLAPDGSRWVATQKGFLFPVRAMSKLFRGKFIAALETEIERGALPGEMLAPSQLAGLRQKSWVVYAKPPFAGPKHVLAYLGRYTHRIALSNNRILGLEGDTVSFAWRDYADEQQSKILKLPVCEFIRRFLLHVLPKNFMRIRHYGLLANRARQHKIPICRNLLNATAPAAPPEKESLETRIERLLGIDVLSCPHCKTGRMHKVSLLDPGQAPSLTVPVMDSS